MTNSELPGDNIDARLNALGDELDQLRTEMRQVPEETRYNSQTISRLQGTVAELVEIARLHQQALRISERNAEQDRDVTRQLLTQMRGIQTENQRILGHLFGQQDE
ncbi:hypothetical protein NIES4071_84450 [Calothrix sp. NIES-4071]|nr:hypothetical protein NIES4071_84450 [Calothrix sp. NIES-4071]BAZ62713.1 hypothetical protein NIES4105_84380 [Calothrix sp. NIES-4105]